MRRRILASVAKATDGGVPFVSFGSAYSSSEFRFGINIPAISGDIYKTLKFAVSFGEIPTKPAINVFTNSNLSNASNIETIQSGGKFGLGYGSIQRELEIDTVYEIEVKKGKTVVGGQYDAPVGFAIMNYWGGDLHLRYNSAMSGVARFHSMCIIGTDHTTIEANFLPELHNGKPSFHDSVSDRYLDLPNGSVYGRA